MASVELVKRSVRSDGSVLLKVKTPSLTNFVRKGEFGVWRDPLGFPANDEIRIALDEIERSANENH